MSILCLSKNNDLLLLIINFTRSSSDILYQFFNLFTYQAKKFMDNGLFIDVLTLREIYVKLCHNLSMALHLYN